jgi:LasA protease
MNKLTFRLTILITLVAASCTPSIPVEQLSTPADSFSAPAAAVFTPLPTRPTYRPGELVDYTAQSGDTLPALASRFNTSVEEILIANSFIPLDATTMPPGMPMKIPIYYLPLWASPYQIIPDHAFVDGPTLIGFNTTAFVDSQEGWLKNYRAYAGSAWRSGAGIVDYVAANFSISPRLLLAILEYQSGALSLPEKPSSPFILEYNEKYHGSVYLQLVWAANTLNNGYYSWRTGELTTFDLPDGSQYRPDPWQNAASVSLQYYFSQTRFGDRFHTAVGPSGLARVYRKLFGDPWLDPITLIPGSLRQPEMPLPFQPVLYGRAAHRLGTGHALLCNRLRAALRQKRMLRGRRQELRYRHGRRDGRALGTGYGGARPGRRRQRTHGLGHRVPARANERPRPARAGGQTR